MNSDKKLALLVVAIALIIGLSVASVAVARNVQSQRACMAAGCVQWQDCSQGPGCPRFVPEGAAGGGACACCN
ncbi:MAG: hypothetical protein FWE46_03215 [Coriobacteriia bacterium]|nr:hypothetical protein [Coriobacteriia bacterium]